MTSTLRTVPEAGGLGALSSRGGPGVFSLTLAGLDQSGRGGGGGRSFFCGERHSGGFVPSVLG